MITTAPEPLTSSDRVGGIYNLLLFPEATSYGIAEISCNFWQSSSKNCQNQRHHCLTEVIAVLKFLAIPLSKLYEIV